MEYYIIKESDELARRIPKVPSHFNSETGRPTSAVFKTKNEEDGLSVDVLSLTTKENAVQNQEKYALAIFKAELPLSEGFQCLHDPKEDNEAHALIVGDTKKIAKKLAEACKIWFK
jgi:hypothetical protein